jgi:hypothetical protein
MGFRGEGALVMRANSEKCKIVLADFCIYENRICFGSVGCEGKPKGARSKTTQSRAEQKAMRNCVLRQANTS